MKNKRIIFLASLITMAATIFISACNKKFDEPPAQATSLAETGLKQTMTIDEFKNKTYVASGGYYSVKDSMVIVGRVTANDKSGNFYKQIYLQDTSGAIELDLDVSGGLYNQFPIGREVAVMVKSGLYVANVTGMQKICMKTVQNGSPAILGIPQNLLNNYVKAGQIFDPIQPQIVTVAQLNPKLKGSLIQLQNFEVPFPDVLFSTWGDSSANKNTVNINIASCSGEATIIRSSAYANFAAQPVPIGNGSITAIYTVYNTTNQLIIRDTADVQFKGTRCDGSVPSNLRLRTIHDIRALGPNDTIPTYDIIEGVVVSSTVNESSRNYRIQDATGGIQIRMVSSTVDRYWALGDKVRVFIGKQLVSIYPAGNGDLQINNIPGAITIGTGTVTPRITTIQDLNTNFHDWTSTVVQLNNVTITPAGGGNYTITDATGSIGTYIRSTFNFVPPATASSVTGYVSIFSGAAQITLRQAADVQ